MRHSLNIVVALLSMAAGAWHGTTAHTDERSPTGYLGAASQARRQIVLGGCVEKGAAPGTYLLVTPQAVHESGVASASPPVAPPQADDRPSTTTAGGPRALKAAYAVVSGTPEVDPTRLVGRQVVARGPCE